MQLLVRSSATNEGSGTVDQVKPRAIGTREMVSILGAFAGQTCQYSSGIAVLA
jgi:hypothetical protein